MKVFKFGGASVKSAGAIQKVAAILKDSNRPLLVVFSAIGKTTNALEKILNEFLAGGPYRESLQQLNHEHQKIAHLLFPDRHPVFHQISEFMADVEKGLNRQQPYGELYDCVVSMGEILSTVIVFEYLKTIGIPVEWVDARKIIITDSTFREGVVDFGATKLKIQSQVPLLKERIVITQGFIGSNESGQTTTLGREGSDYSAAIFGSCLLAESVTIWKDVPGVMNADPKRLPAAIVFDELPFQEAAEMTYYGASVIHPKTIKPLANAGIPLYVKNFDDPSLPGTIIHQCVVDKIPPLIVIKDNQCLISCKVTDYSFINEEQLSLIFSAISRQHVKVNLMQNSAISFSFCTDFREDQIMPLVDTLSRDFEVYYNTGLTLVTIKNHDAKLFQEYRSNPGVILEQSSRSALQVLIKGQWS